MKKILLTLTLALSFTTICHAQKADWVKLVDVEKHEISTKSFIMSHTGEDDFVGMVTQDYDKGENETIVRKKIMKATDCYSDDGQGTLYTLGKKDEIEDKNSITLKNLALFETSLPSLEAKLICQKYANFIIAHTESESDMRVINNYQVILEQFSKFNDYLGQPHVVIKAKLINNSTYDLYVEKFSIKKEDCDKKKGNLQRFSLDLKDQGMFHFDLSDKKNTTGNLEGLVSQICSQYGQLTPQ